jgi:hypothetical protein
LAGQQQQVCLFSTNAQTARSKRDAETSRAKRRIRRSMAGCCLFCHLPSAVGKGALDLTGATHAPPYLFVYLALQSKTAVALSLNPAARIKSLSSRRPVFIFHFRNL